MEKVLYVSKKAVMDIEFETFLQLDFNLHVPSELITPHVMKIISAWEFSNLQEYLGKKSYDLFVQSQKSQWIFFSQSIVAFYFISSASSFLASKACLFMKDLNDSVTAPEPWCVVSSSTSSSSNRAASWDPACRKHTSGTNCLLVFSWVRWSSSLAIWGEGLSDSKAMKKKKRKRKKETEQNITYSREGAFQGFEPPYRSTHRPSEGRPQEAWCCRRSPRPCARGAYLLKWFGQSSQTRSCSGRQRRQLEVAEYG